MKEKTTEKGRAWLKREMRPYRPFVLFMAFLTVAGTLLSLAFAYLTRYIVNNAVEGNARLLLVFSAVLLAVLLARIAVQTSVKYFLERARAKINAGLRGKLFARILRSDYAGLEKYHSGDLLNRLTTDVSAVASGTVSMLPALAGMAVQCVGAIAALLTLDALFTGIFVAGGLSVCALTVLVRRKMKKYHKELVEADGKSRSFIQESLSSALTVKAYGAEDKATEKSDALLDSYFGKRMKKNRLDSCMSGLFSLFSNAGVIFALVWCGISILRGNMDYGSVLSIILLLGQLEYPFAAFSSVMPVYYARAASAERLSELDDIPSEKILPAPPVPSSSSEPFSPSAPLSSSVPPSPSVPSSSSAPLSSSESFTSSAQPSSSAPLSSSESFTPSAQPSSSAPPSPSVSSSSSVPSSSLAPLSSSEPFSPSAPSLSPTPTPSPSPSAHRYNSFPVPSSVLPFTENSLASGLYKQTKGFRIKKLTFDYGRERLFWEADAEFAKGGVICITGESGSGKSTLFKLLMHIYAPLSGGIYAVTGDGEHLLTERERGLFAYVPQGNFLFSGTIRENLAFFSEEENEAALEERERRALKAACAEFVFGLPEGLDTPLRERGGGLSEGQLQRLAVARALLSDRPILLLDEATSALDGETAEKWEHAYRVGVHADIQQEFAWEEIKERFSKEGIKLLPLKGILLKSLYPEPAFRSMGDLDILYEEKDFEKIKALMRESGYEYRKESAGSNHQIFFRPPVTTVELHRALLNETSPFAEYYKDVWRRALPTAEPFVCRLSREDEYIFLLIHGHKHFSGAGSGVRTILDFWLYLKRYGKELDRKYIAAELSRAQEIARQSASPSIQETSRTAKSEDLRNTEPETAFNPFEETAPVITAETAAETEASLEEFEKTLEREIILWFSAENPTLDETGVALLSDGVYGRIEKLWDKGLKEQGKGRYLTGRLFPPYKVMKQRYTLLEKLPFLLPFFWIWRLIRAAFCRRKAAAAEYRYIREKSRKEKKSG